MPIIYFGVEISDTSLPQAHSSFVNQYRLDFKGLLGFLEVHYGLHTKQERLEFLRVEQYRQLLQFYLEQDQAAFYRASFVADPLATAENMLSRRDELIAANYPLHIKASENCPDRIGLLHQLEDLLLDGDSPFKLHNGLADRLQELIAVLRSDGHPPVYLRLHQPFRLLEPGCRRLLQKLHELGECIQYLPQPELRDPRTDLGLWQTAIKERQITTIKDEFVLSSEAEVPTSFLERLSAGEQKTVRAYSTKTVDHSSVNSVEKKLLADGSLIILRAERETHLAAYLAKVLASNKTWRPAVLMPQKRQTLGNALRMEDLPSLGVPSASLARPSLQVLKLVTSFLWEPVDMRKLMEFLGLVIKPLHRVLGYRLAAALADSPGLYSETWFRALNQFMEEELPRLKEKDSSLKADLIKEQYEFWFRRNRYPQTDKAPKAELRRLFSFLINWVRNPSELEKGDSTGLLTLAAQAERAIELIDTLAEEELNPLEVDRIVRTVYEPAPAQFNTEEIGRLDVGYQAGAVHGPVQELIWWDFVQEDPAYFFSRWYAQELDYFRQGNWSEKQLTKGIQLMAPDTQNDLLVWSETRPVLHSQERLVLCIPKRIEGTEMLMHNLWGDLEALFGTSLDRIVVDIDSQTDYSWLPWQLPEFDHLALKPLSKPLPFVDIPDADRLHSREYETPTSIEDYLYHPHLWTLRYGAKIKASQQLSLKLGSRLRGKLAHRFIENLLKDDRSIADWTKPQVYQWIQDHEPEILRKEGGLLLEYGAEPDRVQFRRQVQLAAWALITSLQENAWTKALTEVPLSGTIAGQAVKGRADLVVAKENGRTAIIDLKWRGKTKFSNLIRNQEDLQLTVYANLVEQSSTTVVKTAYFLLSDALMIARNQTAFSKAEAIDAEADDQKVQASILTKLGATYQWRAGQLRAGQLEIRCSETIADLEEAYQDLDYDELLEMREDDARYDDYRALIGVIR